MNVSRSKYAQQTFTISEQGGMLHYSNGWTSEYDFACDGREYVTTNDATISCTTSGERSFSTTSKRGGKEISRSRRTIGTDGKSLTIETSGRTVDGSPFNFTQKWIRTAGEQGLVRTWKADREVSAEPRVMEISIVGEIFRQQYLSTKETYQGKLDGSSIVVTGPESHQARQPR